MKTFRLPADEYLSLEASGLVAALVLAEAGVTTKWTMMRTRVMPCGAVLR